MADMLKLTWWYLLLRGVVALLFGLIVIAFPEGVLLSSTIIFVVLFSVYALIDGGASIVGALRQREGHWFAVLLWGILSILGALAVIVYPLMATAFALRIFAIIIGLRALVTGFYEMLTAWRLRDEIEDEWFLGLSGLFSALFGLILLLRPFSTLAILALFVGFYALIYGVLLTMLAFKVRGWSEALTEIREMMRSSSPSTSTEPTTVPATDTLKAAAPNTYTAPATPPKLDETADTEATFNVVEDDQLVAGVRMTEAEAVPEAIADTQSEPAELNHEMEDQAETPDEVATPTEEVTTLDEAETPDEVTTSEEADAEIETTVTDDEEPEEISSSEMGDEDATFVFPQVDAPESNRAIEEDGTPTETAETEEANKNTDSETSDEKKTD